MTVVRQEYEREMYGDSCNIKIRKVGYNRFKETAVLRNTAGWGMYMGVES